MQRMSYLYFLYFYNQQSMQNQNYRSVPISEEIMPIEVQLENAKDFKEVDFKLFVLLILIVFLGLLVNKHEQQMERQSQVPIKTHPNQDTAQLALPNLPNQLQKDLLQKMEENQESLPSKKQLYSQDKTLQTNPNIFSQKQATILKAAPFTEQQPQDKANQAPSGAKNPSMGQKSLQNLPLSKQEEEQSEKARAKGHRKLMRKYVEFYFWFPFFIFALIVYSCYEKQIASSSIFIEVKKKQEFMSAVCVQDCSICINEMKRDDLLAVLPCSNKHVFHSGCIKEWLQLKKTCPICRCDVRQSRKLTK